jgi:hypothetical protein
MLLPCNLSQLHPRTLYVVHNTSHPRTLYVVHNTSHAHKVKQTQDCIYIGTICTRGCHTQRKKLESVMLKDVVPQAPLQQLPLLMEKLQ